MIIINMKTKLHSQEKRDNMIKSLYIHIPFCNNICSYCDFCKIYYNDDIALSYLTELEKEIKQNYKNEKLKTIYIGGGTPSSLSFKNLERLFSITNSLNIENNYEFTFECNIEDINEELLKMLKENKVNRLSIGVESFNKKILRFLGRNEVIDIDKKINLAKQYFTNINIDLIYGIKGQTLEDLKKDLDNFLNLDIKHISIYSLILEDNTILKINNYEEISDDLSRKMYDLIRKTLKENGFSHYEISKKKKKGYESKHNLTYWNNEKYYGFGLGASGYIENYRYTNTRSISSYLKGKYILEKEEISKKINMENFMILGLRKIKGVSNTDFKERYNKNIEDVFNTEKLDKNDDTYYINENNLYISNYILEDFIDI